MAMYDYDRSNFIAFLKEFPSQIDEALQIVRGIQPQVEVDSISNVIITGMGGSAIAGDLILGYLHEDLKLPAIVNRNYHIPQFVNHNTLFIAVSYSGDTEETLSSVRAAVEKSARVIGISSGGELEKICRDHQLTHIKIPGGLPPRQALGYLFFPLLGIFENLGMIPGQTEQIEETRVLVRNLVSRYSPETSFGNNLANHIAQSIYHAIPVIYAGVPYLAPVTVRWRNQFNENSKAMAFSNLFPELNHNEIMGWEGLEGVNKHFRVIMLRDQEENPRIRQRIEITKDILRKKHILFGEIYSEGHSRLARLFSLIVTGDWASYYWAMLNEIDPIKIDSIDLLKQRLSEVRP